MRLTIPALLGAMLFTLAGGPVVAEPTEIVVRAISKGAKFIGTSMGGVQATLRAADTGEILATGITAGDTGDTARIMKEPRARGGVLANDSAAKYVAILDLDRPRRIEVTALGPMAQPQAATRVSATQWVVPGKHVNGGDGWLLEIPGLVVDVLQPPAHVKLAGTQTVALSANVTMMCGCPIEPGGLWDASGFEVSAALYRDGRFQRTVPLGYAGATSQFGAEIDITETGTYEATVTAWQPATGNTGLDRVTFIVTAAPAR